MNLKVLVFPAGTEIAFEILNSLKYSKFIEIYGGTSVADHSSFVFRNLILGFPYVNQDGFLEYLNGVIKKYKIDCVYPAHDDVSVFLSDNREKISAKVIISDKSTTNICRSKRLTYELFSNEKFIPKVFSINTAFDNLPVFVKPEIGQGSVGARCIRNRSELEQLNADEDKFVVCEYLPGDEYTVDCFTDKYGILRVTKLRNRQRIRAGISVRSEICHIDNDIQYIAKVINQKLHFIGAWFFQVKKDADGFFKLLEISPRIPGTMGLSRNLGINFPLLTLYVFYGYDISIIDNSYPIIVDRAFYSAYKIGIVYSHIYLDFDDTLIIKNKVNTDLIKFLYQSKNDGKFIHLLSKHNGNLIEDLKSYCISTDLFDDIVCIDLDDEKSNYIDFKDSIYIDDSFAERNKIYSTLKIPVFDVDMVESLIDWKY